MKNGTQASVHVVLQGKGGVGKSFVSAILAQYFRTKSAPVYCLDTDQVNATFAQYRLLEAEHLKVLRRGTVNEKQFDVLVERVCQGDGVFIVDTGATTWTRVRPPSCRCGTIFWRMRSSLSSAPTAATSSS